MSSFEDIVNEGKKRATDQPTSSTQHDLRQLVKKFMESLHELNAFYEEPDEHLVNIEPKSCENCNKACYVVITRSTANKDQKTRYYRSKWKKKGSSYVCDECQGA